MIDEIKESELEEEYEETFDNEEKLSHSMKLDKGAFTLTIGVIDFDDLLIPEPLKIGRKETYLGLTTSISELGIVNPIHVMVSESYANWVSKNKDNEDFDEKDYAGYKYILIQGFRRVYSGYKAGLKRCNAVIWDFKDKEKGQDIQLVLSSILHRSQKHSWLETWELYRLLMSESEISEATAEYLLGLETGDAPKLKSIMDRADEFPEPKEDLLSNKKDLKQAFNTLQKAMKEVDRLSLDDNIGISEMEQADGIVPLGTSKDNTLSDMEVQEILEMQNSMSGDLSEDDFDELNGTNLESERFEVHGDRHLDPKLRAAVLQRDGYKCRVTGFGEGLPAEVALAILQVHHLVPVADGGTNDIDNLITLSQDPHTLVHVIQRRMGKLGMKKEDFDALPQNMKDYLSKVMRIARIAVEADKRCGKTREQVKKDTSGMHYEMPGKILQENLDALKESNTNEIMKEDKGKDL